MSNVEQRVKLIVSEMMGINVEEINSKHKLIDDLGADSLDLIETLMCLEEEFEIEILDHEAERLELISSTIDEIVKYIESRV